MNSQTTTDLSFDEVLTTTRSVRKRLDLEKSVAREVIMECLDLALQAPSGSNQQSWQFVFVEDDELKKELAAIYRVAAEPYLDSEKPTFGDIRDAQTPKVNDSARYLSDHMHEVPVLMIPCIAGRPDGEEPAGYWGSLLPAVWSFMLALRSRGLGSAWTSLHLHGDGEKRAAEVLGIPFDKYSQGGMFPIAYTKGTDFKKARRLPAEELTHWNGW